MHPDKAGGCLEFPPTQQLSFFGVRSLSRCRTLDSHDGYDRTFFTRMPVTHVMGFRCAMGEGVVILPGISVDFLLTQHKLKKHLRTGNVERSAGFSSYMWLECMWTSSLLHTHTMDSSLTADVVEWSAAVLHIEVRNMF